METNENTVTNEEGCISFDKLLNEEIQKIEDIHSDRYLQGISTGFKSLDKKLNGLKKSDFIVIGGDPSIGKTTFALSIMLNVAVNQNLPVLYISLESPASKLLKRIIRMRSDISFDRLKNAPIFIDDRPRLTIDHICNIVRSLIEEKGIRLVIIDYIQLITGDEKSQVNREQEISSISRELKFLSKECEIPIIATSTLSRQNQRIISSNSYPTIFDLRESGSIAYESDIVLLLHRPNYYSTCENDDKKLTIIIGKNRDGEIGEVSLNYDLTNSHISEFEINESEYNEFSQERFTECESSLNHFLK